MTQITSFFKKFDEKCKSNQTKSIRFYVKLEDVWIFLPGHFNEVFDFSQPENVAIFFLWKNIKFSNSVIEK